MFRFNSSCVSGICINRPSKKIKSPYVADIKLDNDDNIYTAHSPALSLGNLIKPGARLYVLKNNNTKTDYSIKIVYDDNYNTWVGATPLDANRLFKWCFINKYFNNLIPDGTLSSEVKYGDSRIDFCIDNNTYIEIKCVPLKKDDYCYFPDGYRKSKKDTISPRAIKHINELSGLGSNAIIVFIVLRDDCEYFRPNEKDPLFCKTLKNAISKGVKVHIFSFKCSNEGYTFSKKLELVC